MLRVTSDQRRLPETIQQLARSRISAKAQEVSCGMELAESDEETGGGRRGYGDGVKSDRTG